MHIIYFVSDSKRACSPHGGGLRFLKLDFNFGSYRIFIIRTIKSTYIILYSLLHAYIISYHRYAIQGGCLFNNRCRTGHFLSKCIRQAFSYNISISILDYRSERCG